MRRTLLLAAGGLLVSPALVRAQPAPGLPAGWPSRTLRIVVPSAPGGPFDLIARYLAERLGPVLGQNVIVEHKSGATGTIGMGEVARAAPDGHTFGLLYMPLVIVPHMFGKLPYDTLSDLAPVVQTNWTYNVLVVHPDVPARSLAELIALARSRPGALSFASGANGSPAHVLAESLKAATGTFAVHVPYRGVAGAVQGLIGGQVQYMFMSAGAAVPLAKSGRVHALAVTSPQRLAALPDVPTLAEAGYPKLDVRDWWGLVAPAATPAAIIDRVNAEVRKALADPAAVKRFSDAGIFVHTGTPAEFGDLMRSEFAKWGELVRRQGLKPD